MIADLRILLGGELGAGSDPEIVAVSLLSGSEQTISDAEFRLLTRVPAHVWRSASQIVEALNVEWKLIDGLIDKGLLVSDGDEPVAAEFRRRDERLQKQQWYPYAALYHFMGKWMDVHRHEDVPRDIEEYGVELQRQLEAHVEESEPASPHFLELSEPDSTRDLPLPEDGGDLYRLLSMRRTGRVFDRSQSLPYDVFAKILYYVYGCHGLSRFSEKLSVIKKTSPSGGSMHPIEVYPLALRVEGVDPGIYHYSVRRHALEPLQALRSEEAEELASEFTAGQAFARDAHALFILTARFHRNFWKYPNHAKAYRVLLMDAAHLSQTFYLVCTELNLGAFFTTAINEVNIEEKLGIDEMVEGALAISACGIADPNPPRRPFSHGPYTFPQQRR